MDRPTISPDFNMSDIRKIRDYSSLRHANMTKEEVIADIKEGAKEGFAILHRLKTEKSVISH